MVCGARGRRFGVGVKVAGRRRRGTDERGCGESVGCDGEFVGCVLDDDKVWSVGKFE